MTSENEVLVLGKNSYRVVWLVTGKNPDGRKITLFGTSVGGNYREVETLWHKSVAFTMDVYSDIIEGMQVDAIALLDEVVPAGVSQKNNAK